LSVCVITPRLPPAIDGVGDYTRQLWLQFAKPGFAPASSIFGTPWYFLVTEGAEATNTCCPEVAVSEFECTKFGLLTALEKQPYSTVFLQYVGYGYSPDGAPMWLPGALGHWQAEEPARQVAVMFHEMWANGTPWQRAFWYSRSQKRCARELLKIASHAAVSVKINADAAAFLEPEKRIAIIPIGANFSVSPAAEKQWDRMLIFGREATRLATIRQHQRLIKALDRQRIVKTIVLGGEKVESSSDPALAFLRKLRLNNEINVCYNFPANAVPEEVTMCGLALMYTQSTYLLKSGSFQLAARLGQVAITRDEGPADEPFSSGTHFLSYRSEEVSKLARELQDRSRLSGIAAACQSASQQYFNWERIAELWWRLVERGTIATF
jgi:hypothetical protein